MNKDSKIYLAGHTGLVGSAIHRKLTEKGYKNIIAATLQQLDLTDQQRVSEFFRSEKPEYVFLAAAKVGGIIANNTYRAEFIYENLQIQNNVIHHSFLNGVKKLLFLGSTCIYPKECPQPIKEEYLLTDPLEYSNEPYAIAKIAGIKTCESYNIQYGTDFISVMPTNVYGYRDNFHLERSHVLPAIIRKVYLCKCLEENDLPAVRQDMKIYPVEGISDSSTDADIIRKLEKFGIFRDEGNKPPVVRLLLWGTGQPKREFIWSDDLADALVYIMEKVSFKDLITDKKEIRNTHINIGTGEEISIKELAELVKKTIGFKGLIEFDSSKPDGTPRKLTDVSKLHRLGWRHRISLKEGIEKIYSWYIGATRDKEKD
jgi:GDP-L-fucose synthase